MERQVVWFDNGGLARILRTIIKIGRGHTRNGNGIRRQAAVTKPKKESIDYK
jgi:hypothetical protein